MYKNKFPLLSEHDQLVLHDALHYMKMVELAKVCQMLSLPDKSKKMELIDRIVLFVKMGQIKQPVKMPAVSLAKNYPVQTLQPLSLMFHGSYKNDLKSRNFFKQLIGSHFHFTAFGIDWLNERWMAGKPPTYQEFAQFWIDEMVLRKHEKPKPKDEWMFIRFMQEIEKTYPDCSQAELMQEWKKIQAQKAQEVITLISKVLK